MIYGGNVTFKWFKEMEDGEIAEVIKKKDNQKLKEELKSKKICKAMDK